MEGMFVGSFFVVRKRSVRKGSPYEKAEAHALPPTHQNSPYTRKSPSIATLNSRNVLTTCTPSTCGLMMCM